MQFELSGEQSKIVEALMASGRFGSPEEVIGKALASLSSQEQEYHATVTDIEASLEDERAGRISSIHEVAGRIRQQHGFTSPS